MDPVARTLTGLLLGIAASSGCEPQESCRRGTEACTCTADGECLAALECISGYCVDPNWVPDDDDDDDDDGIAETGGDDATADDDDDDDDGGPVDNVGACEAFVDAFECGAANLGQTLNCEMYASIACDLRSYFDCLADHTGCTSGIPDNSGWIMCTDLASCG